MKGEENGYWIYYENILHALKCLDCLFLFSLLSFLPSFFFLSSSFLMCFPLNLVTEVLCKCSCPRGSSFKSLPPRTCIYSLAVLILMYPFWEFLGSEFPFPCDEYLASKYLISPNYENRFQYNLTEKQRQTKYRF